ARVAQRRASAHRSVPRTTMRRVATGSIVAGTPVRIRRLLTLALLPFALATLTGLIVLWPAHAHHRPARSLGAVTPLVNATVESVESATCPGGGGGRCSTVYVTVTSGPDRGKPAILPDVALGPGVPVLHEGNRVVLGRSVDPTNRRVDYHFDDYQ